ncbi:ribosomal protein L7/L12 [Allocatelliglobosispora scoriae]|uniref:Ribosomal protein L7/L12 n=1 Tax=Allocatelliglobosispora scoriae TaxID=643052 RepID=A0A841BHJ7_9ACTN|nr:hypothetical protein [Allocatelliglobosispora scoriae]MBB5867105.1 ribosomal protein L7/L12 [Allocatelliglobosispora scoriae]
MRRRWVAPTRVGLAAVLVVAVRLLDRPALWWPALLIALVLAVPPIVRAAVPAAPKAPAHPPIPVGDQPGDQRVVVAAHGRFEVLAVLGESLGISRDDAWQLVKTVPSVVARGVSREHAELLADRLNAVGAKATVEPDIPRGGG